MDSANRHDTTENENVSPLTPRQQDVLRWMKDGKSNADIAEIIKVSVKTVEFHVGNIFDRLGASNRVTAVVIAMQRGLI